MPGQMMSVHVGQCGNQLGQSFWKQLCEEHAIDSNGQLTCEEKGDFKESFFYQADDDHYVPRAVLVDLEPRVINGIMANPDFSNLFNTDNFYMSTHGGGAGNNWASGYCQGNEVHEKILDVIEREVENGDNMEGFLFTHSVSGGTGSGLGSVLLEKMKERYPKKIIQTYSVFANQQGQGDSGEASADVVVAPYNSILSLERLIDHADDVVVLDNAALNRLAAGKFKTQTPTFDHINSLVTRIMSTSTSMLRFGSSIFSGISSLNLTPYPPMRFIQAGFSPVVDPNQSFTRKTSVSDIIRYLLKPTSMMVSTGRVTKPTHCMLNGLMLLQGQIDHNELQAYTLAPDSAINSVQRAPWDIISPLRIYETSSSPYIKSQYKVSGLMLNNSTSIAPHFARILSQFQKLRSKNAFVDRFQREDGFTVDMMDESAERVAELISMYEEAETNAFLQ